MQIEGTVGPERGHVPEKLNGLQLAAELQFQHVAKCELIARVERQRLQRGIVQVWIGRREAAHGNRHRGPRTIRQKMRIDSAQNGCRKAVSVANISAQPDAGGGKNRALHREAGAHVRSAAVARLPSNRPGTKGSPSGRDPAVPLPSRDRQHAQNRTIRHRTQGPLPVVIIGRATQRPHSHGVQQRVQGDVDVNAGAGLQANFSCRAGRNEGAETLMEYNPGSKSVAE